MEKLRHIVSHGRKRDSHTLHKSGDYAGAAMTAPATTENTTNLGAGGTQFYEAPHTIGTGVTPGLESQATPGAVYTSEPRAKPTNGTKYKSLNQPTGKATNYHTGNATALSATQVPGATTRVADIPSQTTSSGPQPRDRDPIGNADTAPTHGTRVKNLRFDAGSTVPVSEPRTEQYPAQAGSAGTRTGDTLGSNTSYTRGPATATSGQSYLNRDGTAARSANMAGAGAQEFQNTGNNAGDNTGFYASSQIQPAGSQFSPESPILGKAGQPAHAYSGTSTYRPSDIPREGGYQQRQKGRQLAGLDYPHAMIASKAAGDTSQMDASRAAIVGPHTTYAANKLDPSVNTSGKGHIENAHLHSRSRGGGDYAADRFHHIGDKTLRKGGTGLYEQESKRHRRKSSSGAPLSGLGADVPKAALPGQRKREVKEGTSIKSAFGIHSTTTGPEQLGKNAPEGSSEAEVTHISHNKSQYGVGGKYGAAAHTAGPHKHDWLNKLDPRVHASPDVSQDHYYGSDTAAAGGLGGSGYEGDKSSHVKKDSGVAGLYPDTTTPGGVNSPSVVQGEEREYQPYINHNNFEKSTVASSGHGTEESYHSAARGTDASKAISTASESQGMSYDGGGGVLAGEKAAAGRDSVVRDANQLRERKELNHQGSAPLYRNPIDTDIGSSHGVDSFQGSTSTSSVSATQRDEQLKQDPGGASYKQSFEQQGKGQKRSIPGSYSESPVPQSSKAISGPTGSGKAAGEGEGQSQTMIAGDKYGNNSLRKAPATDFPPAGVDVWTL